MPSSLSRSRSLSTTASSTRPQQRPRRATGTIGRPSYLIRDFIRKDMSGRSDLQIAEVLADLADLNLADAEAAHALVSTHITLSSAFTRRRRSVGPNVPASRTPSSSSIPQSLQRLTSTRRSNVSDVPSPTLRRNKSDRSDVSSLTPLPTPISEGSSASKQLGTAQAEVELNKEDVDPDLKRAAKLMDLYELKGRVQGTDMRELEATRRVVGNIALRTEAWAREMEQERIAKEKENKAWDERIARRRQLDQEADEKRLRERKEKLADGEDESAVGDFA